jgi:hypothetical protein
MDAADETGPVIVTYREIAAHFGLKGVVQARVKAKRAGWPAEPQNHPADPLHIRVPRDVWNAGSRREVEPLSREPRNPRNPSPHTPGLKDEIGGIIKGFEAALETLRQQQTTLQEQLGRERDRADRAETQAAAERERAASAEHLLEEERLHAATLLEQTRTEVEAARIRAERAEVALEELREIPRIRAARSEAPEALSETPRIQAPPEALRRPWWRRLTGR